MYPSLFRLRNKMLLSLSLAICLLSVASAAAIAQRDYDFIIVGGGTAGVALGSRLCQKLESSSILIIEAGPDGRDEAGIYIPGRKGSTLGSRYDWNFTSIPQTGANNRVIGQNRGHVLGGSSALNLLSWDRGAFADYDAWGELGNPGWNAESMFQAMRDAETYHGHSPGASSELEGVGHHGPINFLINRLSPAQQGQFLPAMQNLGVSQPSGYLNGSMIGWMRHTSNIQPSNYTRSYSTAYLADASSNLHLLLDTSVARVNIDGNARATGVTLKDGTVITASKEVVLSAGTLQSPQILERSGIGQKKVLRAAGARQKVHLPGVGENLQDHLRIVASYQLCENYTTPDILRLNATFVAEQLNLWRQNKTSLYDSTSSAYAYLQWDSVVDDFSALLTAAKASANEHKIIDMKKFRNLQDVSKGVPQVEVLFSDGYLGAKGYPATNSSLYGSRFFALVGVIQHPFSRGSSHINNTDIDAKPVFDPNYLSNPYDLQALAQIAKYLRKIAQTPPMSYAWTSEYEPGLGVNSDKEWVEFAKNNMASIWHPVGTCAMLPKENGGVVDPELKVYGVKGLRVVDASVMPALVSGHIQSGVYGIAEMAAQIMSKEWC